MRIIALIVFTILLSFSSYKGYEYFNEYKSFTKLKEDYAEINEVKYGLFNLNLWKEKLFDIFEGKVEAFELSSDDYAAIQKEIDRYLYQLYEDYFVTGAFVDALISSDDDSNNFAFLATLVKDNMPSILEQIDFKAKIPNISNQLMLELKKKDPEIKRAIGEQLTQVLSKASEMAFVDRRQKIFDRYEANDLDEASAILVERIANEEQETNSKLKFLLALLGVSSLCLLALFSVLSFRLAMLCMTALSVVFLTLGVLLPMIDLDARLQGVSLGIFGETISFSEQVLYFQSKSIVDVTRTLLEAGGYDLVIVGILILVFSIILPFTKMVLTTLFLYVERVREMKWAKVIIFYLGKWSMADVFVVAIFMSYIGFYGLLNSQLGSMARISDGSAVETINYSKLSPGIIFFVSYCLLSIIMSGVLQRRTQKNDLA